MTEQMAGGKRVLAALEIVPGPTGCVRYMTSILRLSEFIFWAVFFLQISILINTFIYDWNDVRVIFVSGWNVGF